MMETKHKFNLKSDSTYRHEFSDSVTTERSYLINYDSSGKPSTVRINEMIREAKKGLNQGCVKKQVEEVMHNKTVLKKVERKSGDVIWGSM